jgi:hypothetical protein
MISGMRNLTVYRRFAMIIATPTIVLFATVTRRSGFLVMPALCRASTS